MNELGKALVAESAFAAPGKILQGISNEVVQRTIASVPHSIYEEVWHMAYWQQLSLDWINGVPTPGPADPAEGFPRDRNESWETLHDRFLSGTEAAAVLTNDFKRLEVSVLCPNHSEPNRWMTVHDQLVSLAAHNAYHLGRIVLLRQLLNCWPPPGGGYKF